MTKSKRWFTYASAAWGGFLALAVEVSLARLLRPWFGDMLFVWAAIIGFVLLYLALGNILGGRWSRQATPTHLALILFMAGLGIYLLPWMSHPLLRLAQSGMRTYQVTVPAAAMGVILVILAWPLTLLGTITPISVHLLATSSGEQGGIVGRVLAVSTVASLAGAFAPVFVLLPHLGTRGTFYTLGLAAMAWALFTGNLVRRGRWWVVGAVILGILSLAAWAHVHDPIKGQDPSGRGRVLYEGESAYNFIQVSEVDGEHWLRLNEGEGLHSVWRPEDGLSVGIWDYFLLAPCFMPEPHTSPQSLLVIGLAGGTIPTLYKHAFGDIPMVGVELDPQVVQVAYQFFGLDALPSLRVWVGDGRLYLIQHDTRFDVVAVDAYRPPYIPFHLTTAEFFRLTRDHLTERGVVAVNVARTAEDDRLVRSIAATMHHVFPTVFIVDEPLAGAAWGNSLVVGTRVPITEETVRGRMREASNPYVRAVAEEALPRVRMSTDRTPVWTDDRAPVEQVIHSIMWEFLTGKGG